MPTNTNKPLPCPFCGAEPDVMEPRRLSEDARIACMNDRDCLVIAKVYGPTTEEAIARWNKRNGRTP